MNDAPLARNAHLRVADAPLLRMASPDYDEVSGRRADAEDLNKTGGLAEARLHQVLLMMILLHFSGYLYVTEAPSILQILVWSRYIFWPIVILFLIYYYANSEKTGLARAIAPFSPYFFTGVIATFLGYSFLGGARLLIFWVLGVVASALVGLHLKPGTTLKSVLAGFSIMVATSAAFAILVPSWGTSPDSRMTYGIAWRGLFEGKNFLGEMCAYVILFAIMAPDSPRWGRLAVLALAAFTLLKAGAQGSMVTTLAMIFYWLLVCGLRRLAIPVWTKIAALPTILLGTASIIVFASAPLLALLGRDTKLTGRSDVWPVWLGRALQSFWFGAGPGSFTENGSPVTADLAIAFQSYGTIRSPHNMYIAILGEVGIGGLMSMVLMLLYMTMVLPFIRTGRQTLICGMAAFTMAFGGMSDTHEVFGLGLNMCLVVLLYASTVGPSRDASSARTLLVPR